MLNWCNCTLKTVWSYIGFARLLQLISIMSLHLHDYRKIASTVSIATYNTHSLHADRPELPDKPTRTPCSEQLDPRNAHVWLQQHMVSFLTRQQSPYSSLRVPAAPVRSCTLWLVVVVVEWCCTFPSTLSSWRRSLQAQRALLQSLLFAARVPF